MPFKVTGLTKDVRLSTLLHWKRTVQKKYTIYIYTQLYIVYVVLYLLLDFNGSTARNDHVCSLSGWSSASSKRYCRRQGLAGCCLTAEDQGHG